MLHHRHNNIVTMIGGHGGHTVMIIHVFIYIRPYSPTPRFFKKKSTSFFPFFRIYPIYSSYDFVICTIVWQDTISSLPYIPRNLSQNLYVPSTGIDIHRSPATSTHRPFFRRVVYSVPTCALSHFWRR